MVREHDGSLIFGGGTVTGCPMGRRGGGRIGDVHTRPLLPLEWITVAFLVERLGGKVMISDAEMAAFDRRAELLQYAAPEGGIVLELRRSPFTVAGEVVEDEPPALPVGDG